MLLLDLLTAEPTAANAPGGTTPSNRSAGATSKEAPDDRRR